MMKDMNSLYGEAIKAHNRKPNNFGKSEEFEYVIRAKNPLCGDKFDLYLDIKGGKIINIGFYGMGCALSKASTSVLVESLKDQKLDQAEVILQNFLDYIDQKIEPIDDQFRIFSPVYDFPSRKDCVLLSWKKLGEFMKDHKY